MCSPAPWAATATGFWISIISGSLRLKTSPQRATANRTPSNGDTFVLWGQNQAAYNVTCSPSYNEEYCDSGTSYGIDLYGVRRVPEPATLALFGLGLMGMGWARRRKIGVSQVGLSRIS